MKILFCLFSRFNLITICIFMSLPVHSETVYFSDGFESGDFSNFNFVTRNAAIQSDVAYNGNNSLLLSYNLAEGEPAHADNNRYVIVNVAEHDLQRFFLRGCFMLPTSTQDGRPYLPSGLRKMFYIFSDNYYSADARWDLMISVVGGVKGYPLSINVGTNYYPSFSDLTYAEKNLGQGEIHYDQWHCLEAELKLNTPDIKDGYVKLWLDGSLVLDRQDISIRKNTEGLGFIQVGTQINRVSDINSQAEDRYWDDIKISDTYSSLRPKSPSNLTSQ